MRRRDETDIVTTSFLQFQHHFRQSFVRYFVAFLLFPGLRNLVILAIDAAQIAVAEKDITRAVGSRKRRLFAEMRRVARNNRQPTGIASGDFILQTIIAAVFRTNRAGFEQAFELFNSLCQLPASPERFEFWF